MTVAEPESMPVCASVLRKLQQTAGSARVPGELKCLMNPPELPEEIAIEIERRAMWGEPREETERFLEARGVSPHHAKTALLEAYKERASVIRGVFLKKTMVGLAICAVAVGLIVAIYQSLGGFSGRRGERIMILPMALLMFGAYKLVDGAVGVVMAGSMPGDVADIE
ncbi:MAG: hypothetical protein AAF514_08245 [Verrucomicrobiota bacterium]